MPELLQYLAKLSVSLAIVYIFYQLVLRRLTFYNWNRWYLLAYTAVCFLIPFINITPVLERNDWSQSQVIRFIPSVSSYATNPGQAGPSATSLPSTSWARWDLIIFAFLLGAGIFLLRFIMRYVSFLLIRRHARILSQGEMNIYQVDKDIIPFSFGKSIFINQSLHTQSELTEIIRHEFVHVKQGHTIDIIWAEILCTLNWYNPFCWLLRRSIRQNLEFIADNKVLQSGLDRKHYQYLLLKVVGNNHYSIANNFNFSSLKKRIAMMNKIKSARIHLVRFLFVLPLLAVLLLSFRSIISEKNDPGKNVVRYGGIAFELTNKVPVAGVLVIERNTQQSTMTDEKGYFQFEFPVTRDEMQVDLQFLRDDLIPQTARFELNFKSNPSSKGIMELVGMRYGKKGDPCKDCFSSLSLKYDVQPEKVNYIQLQALFDAYASSTHPVSAVDQSFNDWRPFNIEFVSGDSALVLANENRIQVFGTVKFDLSDDSKGLFIYKGKEYQPQEFRKLFANHTFQNASIYEKADAYRLFGDKGRYGVIVLDDPAILNLDTKTDTIPLNGTIWDPKPSAAETEFIKRHPNVDNIKWAYVSSVASSGSNQANVATNFAKAGDIFLTIYFKNGKWDMYNVNKSQDVDKFRKNYGELPPEAPARPNPSSAILSDKNHFLSIEDNGGNCTVVVRKGDFEEVTRVPLTDWNARKGHYETLYGKLQDHPSTGSNIKNINSVSNDFDITDTKARINLKNGQVEEYDLTNKKEKAAFEGKYGMIVPIGAGKDNGIGVGISAASIGNGVNTGVGTSSRSSTVAGVGVISNRSAGVSAPLIGGIGTGSGTVGVGTQSIISPGASSSVTVIGGNESILTGDESLVITISRTDSKKQLDDYKEKMKKEGTDLRFDEIEYDSNGRLTQLSGSLKNKDSNASFHATDFQKIILAITKIGTRSHFKVHVVGRVVI